MRIFSWIFLRLLDAYAVTLGPHLGGRCRFEPSCSHYAHEAIEQHGPLKGIGLAVRRLIKCGPWHPGGLDPVPDKQYPVGAALRGRPRKPPMAANRT